MRHPCLWVEGVGDGALVVEGGDEDDRRTDAAGREGEAGAGLAGKHARQSYTNIWGLHGHSDTNWTVDLKKTKTIWNRRKVNVAFLILYNWEKY